MTLTNRQYDALRVITQLWLPALGTFYFTISEIFSLPMGTQVVATVTATVTLFGVILGLSRSQFNKSGEQFDGDLTINTTDPEKDLIVLGIGRAIGELQTKDKITLKVINEDV